MSRLLDANANRAREGLRVLEDAARFILDDPELCGEAKGLRHLVTSAVADLLGRRGLAARDAGADVGTGIQEASEFQRPTLVSVIEAAGHRVPEALRALEEYAKVIDADVARSLEQARYRHYDLAGSVGAGMVRFTPSTWRVQVLLTESLCRHPWREVLDRAIAGGADSIQVREPDFTPAQLLARTRDVLSVAAPAGVSVIVNDHADVAVAAGADGVHLGQGDFPVEDARRVIGDGMLLGGSAHDLAEAQRNLDAGCDYCGVGRLFASHTKPDARGAECDVLRDFVASWPTWPHLAIGGISADTIDQVIEAGARAVAVCGAVCGADEPDAVVASMRLALENTTRVPTAGGTE